MQTKKALAIAGVFYVLFAQKMFKNTKKCKKMQKNVRKICIYEKIVVILHRI